MREYTFHLDQFQLAQMMRAIRSKEDVIMIWMHAIKVMLSYVEPTATLRAGVMHLYIGKMSRLFFDHNGKVFSLNFPFNANETDSGITFGNHSCSNIDNRVSSEVIGFLTQHSLFSKLEILEFSDPILEASEWITGIWGLMRDLMLSEDGYLRLDHDPANVNGDRHPLNHVDVFYSLSSTMKLGLRTRISTTDFVSLISRDTDCHYLGASG